MRETPDVQLIERCPNNHNKMFEGLSELQYPTKSAIKNYLIESSVPAYVINRQYVPKPIAKTKEFYRSDQFIWNNPYRASNKTYNYYHKQQDQYRRKEEQVKQQENDDRERVSQERINVFKHLRAEERNRLMSRKMERTKLEDSIFNRSSQRLTSAVSSKKSCRQKGQPKNFETEYTQGSEDIERVVQQMVRSTVLREREERLQQLRERKGEMEDLIKRSGQTLRPKGSRPWTSGKGVGSSRVGET